MYYKILTFCKLSSKLNLRTYYSSENLNFFEVRCNWMTTTDFVSDDWESRRDIRVDIFKWQLLSEE